MEQWCGWAGTSPSLSSVKENQSGFFKIIISMTYFSWLTRFTLLSVLGSVSYKTITSIWLLLSV